MQDDVQSSTLQVQVDKIKLVDSNAGKLVQLLLPRGWNGGPAGRYLLIENCGSLEQSCGCYACGSSPAQSCLVG